MTYGGCMYNKHSCLEKNMSNLNKHLDSARNVLKQVIGTGLHQCSTSLVLPRRHIPGQVENVEVWKLTEVQKWKYGSKSTEVRRKPPISV